MLAPFRLSGNHLGFEFCSKSLTVFVNHLDASRQCRLSPCTLQQWFQLESAVSALHGPRRTIVCTRLLVLWSVMRSLTCCVRPSVFCCVCLICGII